MDADIQLSVMIPTYNRKTQLSNTLDALENQTDSNFKIVISDNHSDYDINDILIGRTKSFLSRIMVYRRRQNIGADANIVNLFTLCDTKWAWFLSDDDRVMTDAIAKILAEIGAHPDAGAFNFSLEEFRQIGHIRIDKSLTDFIDFYYPNHRKLYGDFIFLGNKVFNLERINDCIGYMFMYNYTKVSSIVLIYSILEKHIPYCTVVGTKIVDYISSDNRSWDLTSVALGTRTLMDIPFGLDLEHRRKMLRISTFEWRYILMNNDKSDIWFLYQMYHGLYKYILPFDQKLRLRAYIILLGNRFLLCFFKKYIKVKKRLKRILKVKGE